MEGTQARAQGLTAQQEKGGSYPRLGRRDRKKGERWLMHRHDTLTHPRGARHPPLTGVGVGCRLPKGGHAEGVALAAAQLALLAAAGQDLFLWGGRGVRGEPREGGKQRKGRC